MFRLLLLPTPAPASGPLARATMLVHDETLFVTHDESRLRA